MTENNSNITLSSPNIVETFDFDCTKKIVAKMDKGDRDVAIEICEAIVKEARETRASDVQCLAMTLNCIGRVG